MGEAAKQWQMYVARKTGIHVFSSVPSHNNDEGEVEFGPCEVHNYVFVSSYQNFFVRIAEKANRGEKV
ncbi:unnamed protein product [Sphenostylis stenocarpa]|uniref:Uncharacterized protein n=1 Tax=Sphenostylis stenocarpa TaxID=92480 RepID=A0AA86S3T8_9FABA|nr:unnamed protein product [Sphenostylis stenocarpa]